MFGTISAVFKTRGMGIGFSIVCSFWDPTCIKGARGWIVISYQICSDPTVILVAYIPHDMSF